MNTAIDDSLPFSRVKPGEFLGTVAALERLDYCLEWRPWLWRRPAIHLLAPFERFREKRVLELGARFGRMSCLLASAGAAVNGVDVAGDAIQTARLEAARWGVEDRVRFDVYDGNGRNLPPGPFDVIFSKSVLGMVMKNKLPDLLSHLRSRLAPGGVGLFLENSNNRILEILRKHVIHRRERCWNDIHWGFYRSKLAIVERVFSPMNAKRFNFMVWAIRACGNGPKSSW